MNYLYNGVEVPDINEFWTDKVTYPNALLVPNAGNTTWEVYLYSKSAKIYYGTDYEGYYSLTMDEAGKRQRWQLLSTDRKTWLKIDSFENTTNVIANIKDLETKLVWTNTDLYYADDVADVGGTLYLAASEPIPIPTVNTINPTSLTIGQLIGRVILGQRCRRPVAFLYNGVQLRVLPERDETTYPHVYLYNDPDRGYTLWVCSNPFTAFSDGGDTYIQHDGLSGKYILTDGAWSAMEGGEQSSGHLAVSAGAPVWANHDIRNTDGSVYLAASKPVPVY